MDARSGLLNPRLVVVNLRRNALARLMLTFRPRFRRGNFGKTSTFASPDFRWLFVFHFKLKSKVPPLRERKEDIPLLAHHFLSMYATEMGMAAPMLTPDSLAVLESYAFPGNVRELKNIIERAIIESGGTEIQPKHLHFFRPHMMPSTTPSTHDRSTVENLSLDEMIQTRIEQVLEMTGGNQSKAARRLKISRDQLRYRIEKYRIKTP